MATFPCCYRRPKQNRDQSRSPAKALIEHQNAVVRIEVFQFGRVEIADGGRLCRTSAQVSL
jgi:hypothetical protein